MASVALIDVKLAARMLVKHPSLTILGGLALMLGIPTALAPMQLVFALNTPPPLDRADRVAGIQLEYISPRNERRPTVHDFERWRGGLRSFDTVAASLSRSETIRSGMLTAPARGAAMTASAFDVFGGAPAAGRLFTAADEAPGSAAVVVIGDDVWRDHFNRDPRAIGAMLQVGRTPRTVIGVMPPGFQFPSRQSYWVPLQLRALDFPAGEGPRLLAFGRLRDGVSIEQARADVTRIDAAAFAEWPDVYRGLRSSVLPYTLAVTNLRTGYADSYPIFVLSLMLLAVACGNVGTLMLARLAARSTEIAVRLALGAGRARIVLQVFIEALALTLVSAAAGIALGNAVMERLLPQQFMMSMPFWVNVHVTATGVVAAGGLALFSAVIAGLVPALRATAVTVGDALKRSGPGLPGLSFGSASTALIVAEVALAIAGLAGVSAVARGAFRRVDLGGIPASEYLAASLTVPRDSLDAGGASPENRAARLAETQREIERRLRLDPSVRAVTWADLLPGMDFHGGTIEVEPPQGASGPADRHESKLGFVAPGFFQAVQQPPLIGRDFSAADLRSGPRPVIVNRAFAAQVLGGRPPLGLRIRRLSTVDQKPGPWREVIGVVPDLGMNVLTPERAAGFYEPIAPGDLNGAQLVIRTAGAPLAFAPALRSLVSDVDPGILLDRVSLLSATFSQRLFESRLTALVFTIVAGVSFLLSAAGLYALVAFSVSQRTREIAIRGALGAPRIAIVRHVVGRAAFQLGIGVTAGAALAVVIVPEAVGGYFSIEHWIGMSVAVAAGMAAIGLAACVAPTWRALRIQPSEALKEQG